MSCASRSEDAAARVVSHDHVIARCRIGTISIGDMLRQAGIAEDGN
jgi:hypothetical protein